MYSTHIVFNARMRDAYSGLKPRVSDVMIMNSMLRKPMAIKYMQNSMSMRYLKVECEVIMRLHLLVTRSKQSSSKKREAEHEQRVLYQSHVYLDSGRQWRV